MGKRSVSLSLADGKKVSSRTHTPVTDCLYLDRLMIDVECLRSEGNGVGLYIPVAAYVLVVFLFF
jgi:hypothetical protein